MTTVKNAFPEQKVREYLGVPKKLPIPEGLYSIDLSEQQLAHLVALGAAELEQTQNASPSIGVFLTRFVEYEDVAFQGYIVFPPRQDARVSVEGVTFTTRDTAEALFAVADESNRSADEVTVDIIAEGKVRITLWWD